MLKSTPISRDVVAANGHLLVHNVAGSTYSAAPTLVTDGFFVKVPPARTYDALEFTYSFNGGGADTSLSIRPWFFSTAHDPLSVGGSWLAGKIIENITIGSSSTDVGAPVRRINTVPVDASRMYLQVVSISGTAPTDVYMVAYGIEGIVADVSISDVEVDIDSDTTVNTLGVGGGNFSYFSPNDFTAAYTSATELTLAGLPYIPTDEQFLYVTKYNSSGLATTYYPTDNAMTYNPATGVLSVAGAAFAGTDLGYQVSVLGPDKGYNQPADAFKTLVQNPLNEYLAGDTPFDTSGITDGTSYVYYDMATYDALSLQLSGNGGSGTVTVTLQVSLQDDGTAAASCVYEEATVALTGTVNFTAPAGTAKTALWMIQAPLGAKYIRATVVASTGGANDADLTIYGRRLYV